MTYRGHTNVEMETKELPDTPELVKEDYWTVQELLWGFFIILVTIIVVLAVGYSISFQLPQEKPV
ncbi:hypothetical protein TcasGA2_TC034149 [Tribolium castaneum]|uniref:Uncharacterized protein n=1 Tax=Tribolium castaneum TaxID=7070 RepID=A0A139WCV8_TRICA|nr:hypothetical protein TcasGA2_TC034149 [Tribolium castaneum]